MITAKIFAIGDELLDGVIADINGQKISAWLRDQGIFTEEITLCRDNEVELLRLFQEASTRYDLIITTGGLGPTKDDKTKSVLSTLLKNPLVENAEAKTLVEKHYQRINRTWTKETNHYHLLPAGVKPLYNPLGLAPGLLTKLNQCLILSAPGVPRELNAMLTECFSSCIDEYIKEKRNKRKSVVIRTHSIHEEEIFYKREPKLWSRLETLGSVGSLPTATGVDIHIKIDEADYEKTLSQVKTIMSETTIEDHIWQYGSKSLPEFLIETCRRHGLTLSCAESCTGGLTSSLLTDIAGCSDVYMGSAVTYANVAKEELLSVKSKTLKEFGAVSAQVALEMCEGALKVFDTDVAISFSGIAGPTGGSAEKPVGTVAICVANKKKQKSKVYHFHGNRIALKERFAMRGMMDLLLFIESIYR